MRSDPLWDCSSWWALAVPLLDILTSASRLDPAFFEFGHTTLTHNDRKAVYRIYGNSSTQA